MKSAKRKMGGAWRRKKRALSLHAKQGKDTTMLAGRARIFAPAVQNHSNATRVRQNRQDRSLEEKVKLRGFNLEQKKQEDTEEKTV